jgi:alkylresorcinol/alkylpyrone synthase
LTVPRILSVASAVPPHRVGQEEAKTFARSMFSCVHGDIERLLPIFDNVHIEKSYFCVPQDWFERDHCNP